jgi:hypothetical protein
MTHALLNRTPQSQYMPQNPQNLYRPSIRHQNAALKKEGIYSLSPPRLPILHDSAIAPFLLSRMCSQACDPQKTRNPYVASAQPHLHSPIPLAEIRVPYRVYNDGAKHRRRHRLSIFRIFSRAHYRMMIRLLHKRV